MLIVIAEFQLNIKTTLGDIKPKNQFKHSIDSLKSQIISRFVK